MLDRSSTRYILLLYVCDIILTVTALSLAAVVRIHLPFGKEWTEPGVRLTPEMFIVTIVVWTIVMAMSSAYDARRIVRAIDEARIVTIGVSQSTLVLAGFLYMTFRGLSRLLFITFFVLDLALILGMRMLLRILLKSSSQSPMRGSRVLIVGTNKIAATVGERVAELRWMGLELVGYISEDGTEGAEERTQELLNAPILGRLHDIPGLITSLGISEMIIALPLRAHGDLPMIVAHVGDLSVNVKIVPDFFDLVYFRTTIEDLGGMPLIGIKEPVLSPSGRLVKRLLDLTIASVGLVVTAPLMAVLAILIKLDSPGPVVFRQERVGEGGRVFWMYKLRTMVVNAAEQQTALMRRDEHGNVIFEKRPDDPRVTRLGRFLRRYSLDEIPQLVNVLKGEMSLVGPRPELPIIVENYQPWQRKRFAVPPGMTGWWQIRGRSQQPMNLRTEDDLYYIQNYSLWLDLRILLKTVGAVISGRGAY